MEARSLAGTSHRGLGLWGLPSHTGCVRGSQRCGGLGAPMRSSACNLTSSSSVRGGDSCPSSLRSSHIARAAQWSPPRSDPPPPVPGKRLPVKPESGAVPEAHKVFDEAVIVVKSGRGGNGEVVPAGRGRYVPNHKYKPGGNQPKQIWLPASDPGDGADGGDVVLVCDPGVDSLLHLYQGGGRAGGGGGASAKGGRGSAAGGGGGGGVAGTFCAPDGANANPNTGSGGPKRNRDIKKAHTPALEIPVPPGTVVKRRGTGALLGELLQPGQRLTVVRGGQGGHGVVAPSRQQRQARISRAEREARNKGVEVVEVEDDGWRADSRGQAGQQLTLTLLLRVVADVGLVGFPNAGKSSLLKALTRASPAIAPYPFTTLMPNLGVLSAGGGATRAVLADLPGLIEGAHKGRGLGRNFLRHLRRTGALLHVVDGSGPDPATDYYAVREELRMYNPDYCARPHVVALNKTDLLNANTTATTTTTAITNTTTAAAAATTQSPETAEQLVAAIREAARRQAAEHAEGAYDGPTPREPLAVVPCSAATGEGLKELAAALQRAIGASYISEPDIVRPAPDTLAAARDPTPAAAAAAAAAPSSSSPPSSTRSGLPPPPPPGWYDSDAGGAAAASPSSLAPAAGGDDAWGRTAFDDAAAELGEGELALVMERCRQLGLVDEQGNFTATHGSSAAAADDRDGAGMPRRLHDVLDEQEQPYLDEHPLTGAVNGDGAPDDDEWVELSSLDEQTLAAVLDELERGGADGADDFRLGPELATPAVPTAAAAGRAEGGAGAARGREEEAKGEAAEAAAAEGGEEEEEGELVRMAPADDPDASLLKLSLEELLALEKDW